MKSEKLNTQAQQRGAVVQGRSLPPIPAPVSQYLCDDHEFFRPVRDDMLVENDGTNFPRSVGMQCW
ncbi:MAG: hypothetical protein LBK06_06570 [Planctomycetaceae bacterium]|nr:hypothetical protein [Planctomycetaceae bacterium]